MGYAQQCSSDLFSDDFKKLSKEEIEKIFSKYTTHFSKYMSGGFDKEEEEEEEEEKKSERDRKDYN